MWLSRAQGAETKRGGQVLGSGVSGVHLLIWLSVSWGIQLRSTSLWLDVPISTLAAGRLLCMGGGGEGEDREAGAAPPPHAGGLHPNQNQNLGLTYLPGLQQLVEADNDQQAETRQEDVHEDPAGGREEQLRVRERERE